MGGGESVKALFGRVLFCTDFSENADFAFDFAIDAARRRADCVLFLLHVIPESEAQFWKSYIYEVDGIDEKAKKDIDEVVAERYLKRVPEGLDFRVAMEVGKDSETILSFAKANGIDLIVMGRQGRSGLGKALFGNVTEKIARKAECGVLIIPLSFERRVESEEQDEA